MRFKNRTRFHLGLGPKQSLPPFGISREFSQKEIDANDELGARLSSGVIVEYTGDAAAIPLKKKVDIRYEVDPEITDGKMVTQKTKGKQPVQYIVADGAGSDAISMDAEGTVSSMESAGRKAGDYIEEGVDAGQFNKTTKKNGADAAEAELNLENQLSSYDDEDTLSENESERPEGKDADEAIAEDATMFLKSRGKHGAEVTTAKAMIQTEVTSEMGKVNKVMSENLADGEDVDAVAAGAVADFLRKPLNAKKFIIAKENNPAFLKEVGDISGSDTIKQLVKQRLEELK